MKHFIHHQKATQIMLPDVATLSHKEEGGVARQKISTKAMA